MKRAGSSRTYWRDYYVARYNKHGREEAAVLAMWYDLLIHAFGD